MMITSSSFIWLGVVAAFVVFGLTLFLCRARLGAYRRIPPGLLPMEEQARPVLWEAYVSLEELEGGFMRSQEEKSTQECTDVLPLALRLSQERKEPENVAAETRLSRLRRWLPFPRRPEPSSELEMKPSPYMDGEVSAIILLPRQGILTKDDSSDCSQPDFMYEYALGTKCTRCPDVRSLP